MMDGSPTRKKTLRERISGGFKHKRSRSLTMVPELSDLDESNPTHPAVHPNGARLRPRTPEWEQSRRSLSMSRRRLSRDGQDLSPPTAASSVLSTGLPEMRNSSLKGHYHDLDLPSGGEKPHQAESLHKEGEKVVHWEKVADAVESRPEAYSTTNEIIPQEEEEEEEEAPEIPPRRRTWNGLKRTMRPGQFPNVTPSSVQQQTRPPRPPRPPQHQTDEAFRTGSGLLEASPNARVAAYERAKTERSTSSGSGSSDETDWDSESTAIQKSRSAVPPIKDTPPLFHGKNRESVERGHRSEVVNHIGTAMTENKAPKSPSERKARQRPYHWSINQDLEDLPNASPPSSVSYSNGVLNDPLGDLKRRIREMSIQEDPETTVDVDNEVNVRPAITHEMIKPHVHHINEIRTAKTWRREEHVNIIQPIKDPNPIMLPPQHWAQNPETGEFFKIPTEVGEQLSRDPRYVETVLM